MIKESLLIYLIQNRVDNSVSLTLESCYRTSKHQTKMSLYTFRGVYSYVTNSNNDIVDRTTTLFTVSGILVGGITGYIKPFDKPSSKLTIGEVVFNILFESPFTAAKNAIVIGACGYVSGAVYGRIFKFFFGGTNRTRTIKIVTSISCDKDQRSYHGRSSFVTNTPRDKIKDTKVGRNVPSDVTAATSGNDIESID